MFLSANNNVRNANNNFMITNRVSNTFEAINSLEAIYPQVQSNAILELTNKKATNPNNINAESQRNTLIMVLWVSLVFCSGRFTSAIANMMLLLMQNSPYNWWASAINYFFMALVYSSSILVYMRTNKMFRKKFYKIFFRKDIK